MTLTLNKQQLYTYPGRPTDALYKLIEEVDNRIDEGDSTIQVHVQNMAAKGDFTPTVFEAPADGTISEIAIIPDGAVSKSDSDYLTLDFINGSTQIVTAKTTMSTSPGIALAQGTKVSFTISDGDVDEDDVIAFRTANTGSSGVAFPGALVIIKFASD